MPYTGRLSSENGYFSEFDGIKKRTKGKADRGKIEIIGAIVSVCLSEGPIKRTHIMYKANLSYGALKSYIEELTRCDLIRVSREGLFTATEKGREFLNCYSHIRELLIHDIRKEPGEFEGSEIMPEDARRLVSLGASEELVRKKTLSPNVAKELIKGMLYLREVYGSAIKPGGSLQ